MEQQSIEDLPIIDFEDIVEIFGSEEQAMMMLDMFDKILQAKTEFLKLLDSVLYENSEEIKFWGHKIKGAAGIVSAKRMKKLSEIVQNAGRDKNVELAKEKFSDLLKETRGAHRKALEIISTPQEEIDNILSETYELFEVYTKEKEPKEHIDLEELIENYGDEEMGFNMLCESLRPAFTEINYPEKFYTYLMENNFHELGEAAHKLKGRSSYVCVGKLVAASDKLKVAGRKNQEEECYRYLIDVLEESLFIERYIMIKKLQKDEPREKWINLRPELVKLIEGKDNIPDMITELKNAYQASKGEETKKEPEEKNQTDNMIGSSQDNANIQKENTNNQQQETSSRPDVIFFFDNPTDVVEEVKSDIKVSPSHFHENSIKTVLEPIPEEKEKEENKQEDDKKSGPNNGKSLGSSMSDNNMKFDVKSPEKLPGSSDTNPQIIMFEENKAEREDLHSSKLGKSRSNANLQLEELKEASSENTEPVNFLRKSSSRVLTDPNENNSSRNELKKQDSLPKESAPLLIISSKKKRIKEEQVTDDDYPFDSGLKCNIF